MSNDIVGPDAVHLNLGQRVRIRNWKLVGIWLIGATLGALAFQFQHRVPAGMYGPLLSIFCLSQMLFELLGVAIEKDVIGLPVRPMKLLPIVSVWRKSVAIVNIEGVTFAGSWLGIQVMVVESASAASIAAFQDRKARVKFIDGLKTRAPGLRIYRYM